MPLVKPPLATVNAGQPVTAQGWNAIIGGLNDLYDAVLAFGTGVLQVSVLGTASAPCRRPGRRDPARGRQPGRGAAAPRRRAVLHARRRHPRQLAHLRRAPTASGPRSATSPSRPRAARRRPHAAGVACPTSSASPRQTRWRS